MSQGRETHRSAMGECEAPAPGGAWHAAGNGFRIAGYSPARSSEICRPNELLIRAKAQTEAAFLPSSTWES